MQWENKPFTISTDKEKIDLMYVQQQLAASYWAESIPLSVVKKSVEGSMCFGLYEDGKQLGFARVITDNATFAYLCDVFIDESQRGKGLGKWLMEVIMGHPQLQGLRRFMLGTKDAHGLYRQYGFKELTIPERWMEIGVPGIYKNMPPEN